MVMKRIPPGVNASRAAATEPPHDSNEHILDAGEGLALEAAADQGHGADPALDLAGVGEVDEAVLREVGVDRHLHQPGEAAAEDVGGHAGDGLGIEHAVADDPQPAVALGDEHPAVG
jgi:hypothetical protein